MDFGNIEQIVATLMANEDRKDVEFRHALVMTEFGDLGDYIMNDSRLNPNAKPHGSKQDEVLAYGQAFVQLAALAQLREIKVADAWESASRQNAELEAFPKRGKTGILLRYVGIMKQISSRIGRYITHDPVLNPNARPHGTKAEEVMAYGQVFVQTAALAGLRGITLEDAFEKGLQNWLDADWRKKKAAEQKAADIKTIKGIPASPGYTSGLAEVVTSISEIKRLGSILVVQYAMSDYAAVLRDYSACVSDHGGRTCHLATIAREMNMPCVVGTGNATERIKTGVSIAVDGDKGEVYLL